MFLKYYKMLKQQEIQSFVVPWKVYYKFKRPFCLVFSSFFLTESSFIFCLHLREFETKENTTKFFLINKLVKSFWTYYPWIRLHPHSEVSLFIPYVRSHLTIKLLTQITEYCASTRQAKDMVMHDGTHLKHIFKSLS